MRKILAILVIAVLVLAFVVAASPVFAGQPGVECDEFSSSPGHASGAPGSPFHEGGVSGQHYAGEQDQNDNNPHSVSQYDVACEKVSNH